MSVIMRTLEVHSAQLLMTCVSLQHNTHENVRTGSLAGAGLWGNLPRGAHPQGVPAARGGWAA